MEQPVLGWSLVSAMLLRTMMSGFVAVFLVAVGQPAWAYLETQPGDEEWPEIPGRMGMKAFLGTWSPECDDGAVQKAGKMTVLEGINNRIKVIKRMAYGYRDDAYFFLKIRAAFP